MAAAATFALPAVARAATSVTIEQGTLTVAGDAFRNEIVVTRRTGLYRISDDAAALQADGPCVVLAGGVAECSSVGEIPIRVEGRAGNDVLSVDGATKPAVPRGDGAADVLVRSFGSDTLLGGAGPDLLDGRAGNDVLDGEAAGDRIDGGEGTDTVSYSGRGAGVTVTLPDDTSDRAADDGNAADVVVLALDEQRAQRARLLLTVASVGQRSEPP